MTLPEDIWQTGYKTQTVAFLISRFKLAQLLISLFHRAFFNSIMDNEINTLD